jgi:hypothetical protein
MRIITASYLAVVRLRALIAQEVEVEQAKAQEVTLKEAIDEPAANASEHDNQKENACRALIKEGEIPAPPQSSVPVSPQSQAYRGPKQSKTPLYCESVITTFVTWRFH